MTPYDEGFEACIKALCGDTKTVVLPYPYPSAKLSRYDCGWRICHAINGPIYVERYKDDRLAWNVGGRVWGQE